MINKSNKNVTWQGKALPLQGSSIREGQKAPPFKLVSPDLSDLTLDSIKSSSLIVSVVPSLDTSTCALQTKRFNREIQTLKNTTLLTVSLDLPFAQSRWAETEACLHTSLGSDYKYYSFGSSWGVLIEELGLLARAVFVLDETRSVRHVEYVANLSDEPNYDAALSAIAGLNEIG